MVMLLWYMKGFQIYSSGYTGCPGNSRTADSQYYINYIKFLHQLVKHLPPKNDTKMIDFHEMILLLCPYLKIQSFSNFACF